MQRFDDDDQTEIYNILTERITKTKETKNESDSEQEENNNTHLYLRLENLTDEVTKLKAEKNDMDFKIQDLIKQNYTHELNYGELKKEYDYLLIQLEQKNSIKNTFTSDDENAFSLKVKCNELKGKLDSKEETLKKLLNQKENSDNEFKKKISSLENELELYKGKSIKFDILNEKYEKQLQNEDNKKMKQLLVQYEKTINEQEAQLKGKNGSEMSKLFSKIEECNFLLSNEKENNLKLTKENEHYKGLIIHLEKEVKLKEILLEEFKDYKHSVRIFLL